MSAGRKTWVYRKAEDGTTRAILVKCGLKPRTLTELPNFEQRMAKTFYELEQKQGSRFRGVPDGKGGMHSPKLLRKVWIDNVERDAVIDKQREAARERAQCVC